MSGTNVRLRSSGAAATIRGEDRTVTRFGPDLSTGTPTPEPPIEAVFPVVREVPMSANGGAPTSMTRLRSRARFLELVAGGMGARDAWKLSKATPGDLIELLDDPEVFVAQVAAVRDALVATIPADEAKAAA